jgi:hypothetical protein
MDRDVIVTIMGGKFHHKHLTEAPALRSSLPSLVPAGSLLRIRGEIGAERAVALASARSGDNYKKTRASRRLATDRYCSLNRN